MSERVAVPETAPRPGACDIYASRRSILGAACAAAGLAAFCAYGSTVLFGRGEPLAILFVPLSLWGTVVAVSWGRRLRDGRPALSLTSDGIIDRTGLGAPGFVPWSQIRDVQADYPAHVSLRLEDRHSVRTPLHRRFLRWFMRRPSNEYVIPTRALDTPHAEISRIIFDRHDAWRLEASKRARPSIAPTNVS